MNNTQKLEVTIVPAAPTDILGIIEVFYRAWLATYPNAEVGITVDDIEVYFKKRHSPIYIKKWTKIMANPLEGEINLIAKESGQIIGVCRTLENKDKNILRAMYVLPGFQGLGVGTSLWNFVRKYLNPSKDVFVEAATYYAQAIDFYRRLGFEDTGRRFEDEIFRMKSGAIIPQMEMVLRA